MELLGQVTWGSNATFLAELTRGPQNSGPQIRAIYKPIKGERPLWDFPPNLAKRERAAFVLSEQLGWNLVPPTIIRDGPYGNGSVQLFIECDHSRHYLNMDPVHIEKHLPELMRLCALDFIINSTDRKSGHILLGDDGTIWAIDNALSFHSDFKLRTVVWDFAEEPIPGDILKEIEAFIKAGLDKELLDLLSPQEASAVMNRTQELLNHQHFAADPGVYARPWPLIA